MLQFFRYRRLYMDSATRATGLGGANNSADMARNTPGENTVAGLAVDQQLGLLAPDAVQGGLTNLITHDATTAQIIILQQATSGGASYASGIIAPKYTGVGAPGPATLATGAYYRQWCEYLDITAPLAPNIWICVTAGDKTSSVWYCLTCC